MAAIAERIASAWRRRPVHRLRPSASRRRRHAAGACAAHRYEDVLANPGEADLTSHVDFRGLAASARAHGLDAHLATQGDFLLGMGLAGARRAARRATPTRRRARDCTARSSASPGPTAMGKLFKVLAIAPPGAAAAALRRSD